MVDRGQSSFDTQCGAHLPSLQTAPFEQLSSDKHLTQTFLSVSQSVPDLQSRSALQAQRDTRTIRAPLGFAAILVALAFEAPASAQHQQLPDSQAASVVQLTTE